MSDELPLSEKARRSWQHGCAKSSDERGFDR